MTARSPRPPPRPPQVAADDRGAIMVMGIFMCTLLVGALWYIAGVGDALLFHERMQEAADSVAFSAAIIEARGMNIIVLINLIMAAILAIRVAINMIKLACTVLAAVFAAIALIPFCEWAAAPAEACADGAETMEDADEDTTTPINDALIALNAAWTGVAKATPLAAIAGGVEMETNYKPTVIVNPDPTLGYTTTTGWGLPVTDDSLTTLCDKAVGDLFSSLLPGGLGSIIGGMLSGMVGADPSFFCELPGGSNTPPNVASAGCGQGTQQICQQAQQAQQNYDNLVAQDAGAAAIQAAQDQANSLQNSCNNPNSSAQKNCNNAANGANSSSSSSSSGSGGGDMAPAMVDSNAYPYNGTDHAQIISFLFSDGSGAVNVSPNFVKIAASGKAVNGLGGPALIKGQLNSWAQAEFFYDQPGAWSGMSANAMWNFYWRARFRLTNPSAIPGGSVIDALNAPYSIAIGSDLGTSFGQFNLLNIMTKGKLVEVVTKEKLALH
jgi:hypothetical protein